MIGRLGMAAAAVLLAAGAAQACPGYTASAAPPAMAVAANGLDVVATALTTPTDVSAARKAKKAKKKVAKKTPARAPASGAGGSGGGSTPSARERLPSY